MKIKKNNSAVDLKSIKGLLSRDEMKQVKGGSGKGSCNGGPCQFYYGPPPDCDGYLQPCQ